MNTQVLTDAPGSCVTMKASDIITTNYRRRTDDVRVRFRNGDFVIVSSDVARDLGRLGIIAPP